MSRVSTLFGLSGITDLLKTSDNEQNLALLGLLGIQDLLKRDDDKEESPPEPLVLDAELRCEAGTNSSYLMLETDSLDINNLPQACVEDCVKSVNIMPFGFCN